MEGRCDAERSDLRELGAGLSALGAPAAIDTPRWSSVKRALIHAAELVIHIILGGVTICSRWRSEA